MSHINCPCCDETIKITSYTETIKKAQQKYREKNPEVYNKNSKAYYLRKKEDPEWVLKNNERIRIYQKERLLRKKQEKEELNKEIERLKAILNEK